MVFSHKKFNRGEPKKCRDMRSIVKRPPPASTVFTSSPFDAAGKVEVGAAPNAGGVMADHLLLSNRLGMYHNNPSMRSDGRFVFNTTGEGANLGYSSEPNHHYNGFESTLMDQSQMLGYIMMESAAAPHTSKVFYASSAAEAAASLQANQDYNMTLRQPNPVLSKSADQEVIMASLIMDEHPTLDAWQALQLAKRRLNGTSASFTRLSPW